MTNGTSRTVPDGLLGPIPTARDDEVGHRCVFAQCVYFIDREDLDQRKRSLKNRETTSKTLGSKLSVEIQQYSPDMSFDTLPSDLAVTVACENNRKRFDGSDYTHPHETGGELTVQTGPD